MRIKYYNSYKYICMSIILMKFKFNQLSELNQRICIFCINNTLMSSRLSGSTVFEGKNALFHPENL